MWKHYVRISGDKQFSNFKLNSILKSTLKYATLPIQTEIKNCYFPGYLCYMASTQQLLSIELLSTRLIFLVFQCSCSSNTWLIYGMKQKGVMLSTQNMKKTSSSVQWKCHTLVKSVCLFTLSSTVRMNPLCTGLWTTKSRK